VRLGIDLDNTIIDYARAFADAAVAAGVDGASLRSGKTALRDGLRARPGGEETWQRVQALAYGPLIDRADAFPGVEAFFARARERGLSLAIVSQKSEFAAAAPAGPNLRECAQRWLDARGFVRDGVPAVYFEPTRAAKCARIAELGLTHFIDDLVEVFDDPAFPRACTRWLFAPDDVPASPPAERVFRRWSELADAAFRER
jgi:hypothetical protein